MSINIILDASELSEFSRRMSGFGAVTATESKPEAMPQPKQPAEKKPAVALCHECKSEFKPKRVDSKYCSDKCAAKAYQRDCQRRKLAEISKTCPKPTNRPEHARSFV